MYRLYEGNETYLSLSEAKKCLISLRLDKNAEYLSIDVEKAKAEEIIDILSSKSLFNTQRIIFLKRIYRNKDRENIIKFLLEYLNTNPADHIIIWEDQKINSITKYSKFFKANNLLEEYTKLNKRTFANWAKKILQENNLNIDNNALQILIQYSNYDTERFENNVKKLLLLDKETIYEQDIKNLFPNTLEDDIWKLLDSINNIDGGKPLLILDNLFKQGIDPNYIISMIARNIRLITVAKNMINQGASYGQIASVLKIQPFIVKPVVDASKKYSFERIKIIYEKLSGLDYEIKMGRIEPKLGLTLLCTIL